MLNELNQKQAQDSVQQSLRHAQQQAAANHKNGIAKAFGWIIAAAQVAVGAKLIKTGTDVPLGANLVFSGLLTALVQIFQFPDVEAFLELALKHWDQLAENHRIELVVQSAR